MYAASVFVVSFYRVHRNRYDHREYNLIVGSHLVRADSVESAVVKAREAMVADGYEVAGTEARVTPY